MKDLKDLTAADFEAYVNTQMEVQGIEGEAAWTLSKVSKKAASPGTPKDCRAETFSLLFTAPASVPARQGTYAVKLPDNAGEYHVFMVPVGKDSEKTVPDAEAPTVFQAVFT